MRIKVLCGIIALITLFGCKTLPSPPPDHSPCTFTIPAPLNYDCYLNTAGTGRKIKLSINLITRYANLNNSGPNMVELSDQTVTFDPSVNSFPVTIVADIPNTSYPWTCEVNIQGTECSTCASSYSDPRESNSPNMGCYANVVPGSSPFVYYAAKPRWQKAQSGDNYTATFTMRAAERITNVPNSCTCTTP
jgi:hypothetical protein